MKVVGTQDDKGQQGNDDEIEDEFVSQPRK
jgi:hypothetical protein